MSLSLTVIDKSANQMIVITDKRETGFRGRFRFFKNDESIKHHLINERLCFSAGSYFNWESKPDERLRKVLQFSSDTTEKIIQVVTSLERRYTDIEGHQVFDQISLSGLNDKNEFFILSGQPDGKFTCSYETPGTFVITICTNGEELQEPIMEYLSSRIKKGDLLLDALKRTVKFASKIEMTISPTFNYSIIKKNYGK